MGLIGYLLHFNVLSMGRLPLTYRSCLFIVYTHFIKRRTLSRRIIKPNIERVRLEAVHRVIHGESPEKVITEYGFARSCIYDWLRRHREGGDDALLSRRSPGRPPSFSNEDYRQLLEALLKPPPGLGAWTIRDLLRFLRKRFGAQLNAVTAWRILRKMGMVPVRLRWSGLAIWQRAHPGRINGPIFSIHELTTSHVNEAGRVQDYWLLMASTRRNSILFQLYSDAPSVQTFERFIYKVMPQTAASTTLVLSSSSPRYRQAIKFALQLSQERPGYPPAAKCREQVVGESRDQLSDRQRYRQSLVIYRREA
jgi:transposase